MSKTSKPLRGDELVLAELQQSLAGWHQALDTHRTAPPDSGFAARLAGLAAAAGEQARVHRTAAPDYEWVPHNAGQPPYELQPETGRRGPQNLWRRFDDAVEELGHATEGDDMLAVAAAYEELAKAATKLAQAVEREDHSSPRTRVRARARRSA
jgi:hypothetical protein